MKNNGKLNFLVSINSFVVMALLFFMIILVTNVIVAVADKEMVNIFGTIQLSKLGVIMIFIFGTSLIGYETYQIVKNVDKSKKKKEAEIKQQKEDEFELLKKQIAKVQKLANKANIE